jgi:type I restriction-modification system DNA methylase subunit
MNEQVKELKQQIFKITAHRNDSIRSNETLAFKAFISYSFATQFSDFIKRYKHYGVSEATLEESIYVRPSHFQIDEKLFNSFDLGALIQATNLYSQIVKDLPPFTDVLSMLLEEILLTHKRGSDLGQFLTPRDIADSLTELFNEEQSLRTEPYSIGDICVGAGSLILPPLKMKAIETPEKIGLIKLVLNDIDPIMCTAVALQLITNTVQHNTDLNAVTLTCANAITEYNKKDTMVFGIRTPQIVFDRISEIRNHKKAVRQYDHFSSMIHNVLNIEKVLHSEHH